MKTFLALTTGFLSGAFAGMVYMATLTANRECREYGEVMMPTTHDGSRREEL